MWNQIILALSFALICGWFSFGQEVSYTKDSLETIREKVESNEAILLDVREQDEWDEGHAKLAVLLPMSTLTDAEQCKLACAKFDKSVPIYCHCKVGGRAMRFAEMAKGYGLDVRPIKQKFTQLEPAGFQIETAGP